MIAGLLFVLFGLASFDKDAMERTPTELVRAAPDLRQRILQFNHRVAPQPGKKRET